MRIDTMMSAGKTMIGAFLLGAVLMGSGCVDLTVGARIDGDKVKLVRPGLTTDGEVREYFGAPLHQTQTATGQIWVYRYVSGDLKTIQDLTISFGEDSTVCVVNRDGV